MYLGATEATSKQWLCNSFLPWYNGAKNYNYLRVPLNWLCLIRSKSVYLYHWLAGVGYFHLGGTFNGFHAEPFEQSPRNAFWLPAIVDNYRLDESTCIAFINMASILRLGQGPESNQKVSAGKMSSFCWRDFLRFLSMLSGICLDLLNCYTALPPLKG